MKYNLIDRDAEMRLRADLGMCAAQERGGRTVVVGRGATPISLRLLQTADDVDLTLKCFERLENLGELEAGSLRRRRPLIHDGAVREVDTSEPRSRPGGRGLAERRHRGNHRFEKRQRQRDAGAAEDGTA